MRGLSENDQAAFVQKRIAGGIVFTRAGKEQKSKAVRARSARADMELLHSMLRWATAVRVNGGQRLLDANPLAGVKLPRRDANPRRAVATWERYLATREAITALQASSKDDADRRKWLKLALALILAEATGRRLGSIRQLRWEDIDFSTRTIRWRAEADKKKREWTVRIPQPLADELRSFRLKLGGVFGGLMFPSAGDVSMPVRRDVFDRWLRAAEVKAELPKLDGSLWHAYRRAWATARKDLPLKDVAEAGGWSEVGTLLRCYQQPDDDTMELVMSHPKKITTRAKSG